jgi:hypothetical protein
MRVQRHETVFQEPLFAVWAECIFSTLNARVMGALLHLLLELACGGLLALANVLKIPFKRGAANIGSIFGASNG